ncbi:MAG: hypothetical protein EOP53_05710 [Sphingobacteriales bacterium]|nr:MAG: hypothetical protein EOP53_05710 [Sphingobacteriales bacterium]
MKLSDSELLKIIEELRTFTASERKKKSSLTVDVFFVNAIEIACNLSELGLLNNRQIKKEEEYWFEGSYHMNFWEPEIENSLYSPLSAEIRSRNWFRK